MQMDQLGKENLLKHIDAQIQTLSDAIARKRPATDDGKEQATTWWVRGQIYALEQLKETVKDDKEQ